VDSSSGPVRTFKKIENFVASAENGATMSSSIKSVCLSVSVVISIACESN